MRSQMKCGLTIWLFALPAYGLKIGEGLVFNQSAEGFPTCTGTLISKTYGAVDAHCDSKGGERSDASEAACRESFDVDAAGEMWQCVVEVVDSRSFKCKPGLLCQEDADPSAVWNKLASVAADVKPEMTFKAMSGMTLYGGGKNDALARLTNTKWLACGEIPTHCVAVEMVTGGFLVGNKIDFTGNYYMTQATQVRENKAVMCGGATGYKHISCDLITADSRALTKKDFLQVEKSDAAMVATQNPAMVTLEDGKVFMCFMERDAKGVSNVVCTFLTEKDGSLTSSSKFVLLEKLQWVNQKPVMGVLAKSKVLICVNKGNILRKMICKVLTIGGTSVSSGPEQELTHHTGMGGYYRLAVMNSFAAMFCDPTKHQCFLLSVSGDTLKVEDMVQLNDYGWPHGSVSALWSDRVVYCAGAKVSNRPANPWCVTVTCKDKKCTKGDASHPNDADDKNPKTYYASTLSLVPGKVVVCSEDTNWDGITQGKPFCAVYTLPAQ